MLTNTMNQADLDEACFSIIVALLLTCWVFPFLLNLCGRLVQYQRARILCAQQVDRQVAELLAELDADEGGGFEKVD